MYVFIRLILNAKTLHIAFFITSQTQYSIKAFTPIQAIIKPPKTKRPLMLKTHQRSFCSVISFYLIFPLVGL